MRPFTTRREPPIRAAGCSVAPPLRGGAARSNERTLGSRCAARRQDQRLIRCRGRCRRAFLDGVSVVETIAGFPSFLSSLLSSCDPWKVDLLFIAASGQLVIRALLEVIELKQIAVLIDDQGHVRCEYFGTFAVVVRPSECRRAGWIRARIAVKRRPVCARSQRELFHYRRFLRPAAARRSYTLPPMNCPS